jgi:Ca2+-binding EF-hand superfamily protein
VRKKKIKKAKSVDEAGYLGLQGSSSDESTAWSPPVRLPIMFDAEALRVAFSLLDTDSNGMLSIDELTAALDGMGVPDHVQEAALLSFHEQVAQNKDGLSGGMSYTDFMEWLPRLTTLHSKTNKTCETTASKGTSDKKTSFNHDFCSKRSTSTTNSSDSASAPRSSSSPHSLFKGRPSSSSDSGSLRPPKTSSSPTRIVSKSNSLPSEQDLKEEEERDLRAAFSVFDTDGNGFISRTELREALVLLNESPVEVDSLLKEADIDCDGQISVEDFLLILSSSDLPKNKPPQ